MGLFQKDYLLRLLEQLTEMMAKIRAALAAGRAREALDAIRKARGVLAGPLADSLDRVDAASAVALLGREKARVHGELLQLEADAHAALGDEAAARRAEMRVRAVKHALAIE